MHRCVHNFERTQFQNIHLWSDSELWKSVNKPLFDILNYVVHIKYLAQWAHISYTVNGAIIIIIIITSIMLGILYTLYDNNPI